jgi:septal ring factor EnvC (AmiA/AmiB activator)
MKKLWKYIAGFFTIVIGGLLAFLSGRSAGKRDERIKDIKKDLKATSDTIKKTQKESKAYKKTLASKQKALKEMKKSKQNKPKKKSIKKAKSRLKNIGKGKK